MPNPASTLYCVNKKDHQQRHYWWPLLGWRERLRGEHLTIESLELSEYMRYSSERNQAINIQEVSGRQLPTYWDKVKGKERRSKEWSWQQVKLAVKWNYGKAIEPYNCAEELSVHLTMIVMCQPNLKAKYKLRTNVYFLLTWWWLQPWWNQSSWFKEMKCGYTVRKKWRMSILEFLFVRHKNSSTLYTKLLIMRCGSVGAIAAPGCTFNITLWNTAAFCWHGIMRGSQHP